MIKTTINEELFYEIVNKMVRIQDQNNYEVNRIDLTYIEGQMYVESVCVNEYGGAYSNNDYQEIVLDERELHSVLGIMGEDNFARIYES